MTKDHFHDIAFPLRDFVIIQSQDERFRTHGLRNCFILSNPEDRTELIQILEGFSNNEYKDAGIAVLYTMNSSCFSAEYFMLHSADHITELRDCIIKRRNNDN